jgi:uncharacterized membrane protein YfhO
MVARTTPGWLVALQTFYPGWHARVNGNDVPIERANVAFSAVPVGAGTSDIVLSYDPLSVRLGVLISLVSGVGLLVCAGLLVRLRRLATTMLH